MIRAISLALALLAALAVEAQDKPLEVEVMQVGEGSLYALIALIKGEQKAVLVDVPFTRADAHRVVAMVLDSGKQLETVFVTHDHPDHFFAMEVITEAFPEATVVAHPTVVADVWRSLPFKVKRWSPMLGRNGPKTPTAPAPLSGDTIMLEGQALQVIGPMQGDHVHATALWVPSIRALFAGDLLFDEMHLWLGEHDRAATSAWRDSVERLADLKPETVVPGHAKPGLTATDTSSLEFTRDYLAFWLATSAKAKDSAELRVAVQSRFPDTIDVLGDFLLGNSSKVAMGEAPPWQE